MIKHALDVPRPMTEIERIIREIKPELADDLPQPVQVPGFRDPNDPRIPAAMRQAALRQTQKQYKGRRAR